MAPGLALFHGVMVRSTSVLDMIMMSFGVDGLFHGGGLDQPWRQLLGGGAVLVYAFVVSGIIGRAVHRLMGFRIDEEHEIGGIDLVIHAGTTYDLHATAGARTAGTGVLNVREEGAR